MADFFVLGIGGTGMRCIESLIHLCAMGMFDDTTIHLLALDTDKNNGNFKRLKDLKDAYVNAKGGKNPLSKTFFSAAIEYYEFSPNYQNNSNFVERFDYTITQQKNKHRSDLADLVLTENVEKFNLDHGYRAQTHLGSMMMYHSIVEMADKDCDLTKFLDKFAQSAKNGAKMFILGSVFGGTGASSIPIIPLAFKDTIAKRSGDVSNIIQSAYFGATLLTAYITFKTPNEDQLRKEKIVATSDKFDINSQIAMMFYNADPTVRNAYSRFYMLGCDSKWDPMSRQEGKMAETLTGGASQENDSHYIELMAACAALDFYKTDEATLKKTNDGPQYLYRAVDESGKLDFQDFVDTEDEKSFAQRFGTLIAFSLFCNGDDDFVSKIQEKKHVEIQDFGEIDVNQIKYLKQYFELFHWKKTDNLKDGEGWLRQLHRSAGGSDKFLFNQNLFSPTTQKELMGLKWNKELYRSEGLGKDNKYDYGLVGLGLGGSKFDEFKKKFIEYYKKGDKGQSENKGEQLYKLVFDTLASLYKFEK